MKIRVGFTLFILLMFGCQTLNTLTVIDLFKSDDCIDECWEGLHIGDKEEKVKSFYSSFFETFQYTKGSHSIYSANPPKGYSAQAHIYDGKLKGLSLSASPSFNLTVSDIIQKLGAPRNILFSYNLALEMPSNLYPFVTLYYPDLGFIFRIDFPVRSLTSNNMKICLNGDENVSSINITEHGSLEEIITNANFRTESETEVKEQTDSIVKKVRKWSGFTCSDPLEPV
jgi:hypothetical protein